MTSSKMTDKRLPTDLTELSIAIAEFEAALPGWWWMVGTCNLTRDASCGPDFRDARCSADDIQRFDEGFHCNHKGSLADAIRDVMYQAQAAKSSGVSMNYVHWLPLASVPPGDLQ